jgi:hypothetical protein
MNKKSWIVLILLVLFAFAGCRDVAVEPSPTAVVITTPIPTNTATPTNTPPPTATPFPTGTPEGFEASPTPIAGLENQPEGLIQIRIDPEATDGVKVRSGPGYDCPADDPNCNWEGSAFPVEDRGVPDYAYLLLQVDDTHDIAWCEFYSNFSLGTSWAACEYLRPLDEHDCAMATSLLIAEHLAPCE